MTLPEVVEDIIRTPSSGVITDRDKLDKDYIEALIHQYRAMAINQYWKANKRLDPSWTQTLVINKNKDIQESDSYVIFESPSSIILDNKADGFAFIGNEDGTCAYTRIVSRADLANFNSHRYSSISSTKTLVIWNNGVFEVYGNTLIDTIRVDGVFGNPTEVLTYNKELDDYPLSDDLLISMKALMFQTQIGTITQTPVDRYGTSDPKEKIR